MPDPCGAFFHDVVMAKQLQQRGHTVNFVLTGKTTGARQGVYRGLPWKHYSISEREMNGANIWCSAHFPFLNFVRKLNEKFLKPILVTMHFGENTECVTEYPRLGKWAELLWVISDHNKNHVMNTVALSSAIKLCESVRPLMLENELKFQDRGTLPPGDCITLVNANVLKGLEIFIALARRFPAKKFLGVRPYYNRINVPENIPNIEWINIQDDIRTVLSRTRVMLVPSMYESWGRVAFESMYNGIPVLHTKPFDRTDPRARPSGSTEGMMEWIAGTQFACTYDNIEEWVSAINALDDPVVYAEYSKKAGDQTYAMNVFDDFQIAEKKLIDYATAYPPPADVTKPQIQTSTQQQPSALTLRMPTAGGSALPFRGGRFSVRR